MNIKKYQELLATANLEVEGSIVLFIAKFFIFYIRYIRYIFPLL